ncbi:hypothetical protein [Xanthomonas arboricola]|uniref:hypothetical protein n=1 Tax=Xanthomonas arboricola TaxID=56448 RepID=UPI0009BFFC09|nr:hypothetical protein [Xanthomonas arboricola]
MGRSADYTIQGFLYQFNLTLSEILKAEEDDVVTVEGIVEDIEVENFSGTKAIQCKYHEAKETYALSVLYHPLLEMMRHFKSNPGAKISYHLFAHFPNASATTISEEDILTVLNSKNKDLQSAITEVNGINIPGFLSVFNFSLTPKYTELMAENIKRLEHAGFNKGEVEALFYPNAIQIIADLSIRHDEKLRKIIKKDFLQKLRKIRSTAVSQWTLALKLRDKILAAKRKQLYQGLQVNARSRHIVIFPKFLESFNDEIVLFIKSFVDKYNFKPAHTQTPLFALDVDEDIFTEIAERLFSKEVSVNHGRPIKKFYESSFFRDPMVNKEKKEFVLRLIRWADYKGLAGVSKADDVFVIGDGCVECIDTKDINLEILASEKFAEVQYMMGLKDGY